MSTRYAATLLSLPTGWPRRVRSAVLDVTSLAATAESLLRRPAPRLPQRSLPDRGARFGSGLTSTAVRSRSVRRTLRRGDCAGGTLIQ